MRKISLAKDTNGLLRLCLNNAPLFELGPLDQGFWPDGGYTAPSDEALRYDIEMMKQCGFNMCRKHVKIEPERWYCWCDKLGLLVWQDMPRGAAGNAKTDKRRSDPDAKQFETELQALIEGRFNHPSIVVWIPFNEGWGQYDTERITGWVKQLDPTRLVISASGWLDHGTGDIQAIHGYPFPRPPKLDGKRACVVGEFGGFGLAMPDKTWPGTKTWSYSGQSTPAELAEAYAKVLGLLEPLAKSGQVSGAVYTQLTDVEGEINGLMTYDRAVFKLDPAALAAANRKVCTASASAVPKPGP